MLRASSCVLLLSCCVLALALRFNIFPPLFPITELDTHAGGIQFKATSNREEVALSSCKNGVAEAFQCLHRFLKLYLHLPTTHVVTRQLQMKASGTFSTFTVRAKIWAIRHPITRSAMDQLSNSYVWPCCTVRTDSSATAPTLHASNHKGELALLQRTHVQAFLHNTQPYGSFPVGKENC